MKSATARSRSLPAAPVLRAQLVLACKGVSNRQVAKQLRKNGSYNLDIRPYYDQGLILRGIPCWSAGTA